MAGVLASSFVNLVIGQSTPGQIGSLILDAVISENHSYRNNLTSYPIESGSILTDHVYREPEELTINGFITQTPVALLGGALGGTTSNKYQIGSGTDATYEGQGNRIQEGLSEFLKMAGYDWPIQVESGSATKNAVQRITIVTGLRSYTDMVITSLNIPRDAQTGHTFRFTATFRKILITNTQFSEAESFAPEVANKAANTENQGTSATTKIEETDSVRTSRAFAGAKRWLGK